MQNVSDTVQSWWQKLDLEKWFGTPTNALQVAICFVSFFAVGFLFKKYLKFLFMALLLSFLIIKGLEYYKVLEIDWEAFKALIGFDPHASSDMMINKVASWVKAHWVMTVSSFLGFFIGYKLG